MSSNNPINMEEKCASDEENIAVDSGSLEEEKREDKMSETIEENLDDAKDISNNMEKENGPSHDKENDKDVSINKDHSKDASTSKRLAYSKSCKLPRIQPEDMPHLDLALSPHRTASDCMGLSIKNLHHLKPHVCQGCSVDALYGCGHDTENDVEIGTSVDMLDTASSTDEESIESDYDNEIISEDDYGTEGNNEEENNVERSNKENNTIERNHEDDNNLEINNEIENSLDRSNEAENSLDRNNKEANTMDRNEDANTIERNEEEANTIDRNVEDLKTIHRNNEEANTIDRNVEDLKTIHRNNEEANTVDRNNEEANSIDRNVEDLKTIHRNNEEANTFDRNNEEANTIDRNNEEANTIDRNNEEANTIDRNNEEANTIDRNNEEANTIDRNNEEANTIDRNNEEANTIDRNEEANTIDRNEEANTIDRNEEANTIDRNVEEANTIDRNNEEANSIDRNNEEENTIERDVEKDNMLDGNIAEVNTIDRHVKEANTLDRNVEEVNTIDRNVEAENSLDRNNEAENSLDRNNEDANTIDKIVEDVKTFDRNNEEANTIYRNEEEASTNERNNKEANTIDRSYEAKNYIDKNEEEAKTIERSNEDTNTIDRNNEEENDIDRNNEEANTIDRNEEEANTMDRNDEEDITIERNVAEENSLDMDVEKENCLDAIHEDQNSPDRNIEVAYTLDRNVEEDNRIDRNLNEAEMVKTTNANKLVNDALMIMETVAHTSLCTNGESQDIVKTADFYQSDKQADVCNEFPGIKYIDDCDDFDDEVIVDLSMVIIQDELSDDSIDLSDDDIDFIDDVYEMSHEDSEINKLKGITGVHDNSLFRLNSESDKAYLRAPLCKPESCDGVDVHEIIESFEKLSPSKCETSKKTARKDVYPIPTDSEQKLGAVGGARSECIQGILVKKDSLLSSGPEKKNSVQFSDEVMIETFSADDDVFIHSTVAELAQGDGPSPAASLRMSSTIVDNDEDFILPRFPSPQHVHTIASTGLLPRAASQDIIQHSDLVSQGPRIPQHNLSGTDVKHDLTLQGSSFPQNNLSEQDVKPDMISVGSFEHVYLSLPDEEDFINEMTDDEVVDLNDDSVITIDEIMVDEIIDNENMKAGTSSSVHHNSIQGEHSISVESGVYVLSSVELHSDLEQQTCYRSESDNNVSMHQMAANTSSPKLSKSDDVEFSLPGVDTSLYLIRMDGNEDDIIKRGTVQETYEPISNNEWKKINNDDTKDQENGSVESSSAEEMFRMSMDNDIIETKNDSSDCQEAGVYNKKVEVEKDNTHETGHASESMSPYVMFSETLNGDDDDDDDDDDDVDDDDFVETDNDLSESTETKISNKIDETENTDLNVPEDIPVEPTSPYAMFSTTLNEEDVYVETVHDQPDLHDTEMNNEEPVVKDIKVDTKAPENASVKSSAYAMFSTTLEYDDFEVSESNDVDDIYMANETPEKPYDDFIGNFDIPATGDVDDIGTANETLEKSNDDFLGHFDISAANDVENADIDDVALKNQSSIDEHIHHVVHFDIHSSVDVEGAVNKDKLNYKDDSFVHSVEFVPNSDKTSVGINEVREDEERTRRLRSRMSRWRDRIKRKTRLDNIQQNVYKQSCSDLAINQDFNIGDSDEITEINSDDIDEVTYNIHDSMERDYSVMEDFVRELLDDDDGPSYTNDDEVKFFKDGQSHAYELEFLTNDAGPSYSNDDEVNLFTNEDGHSNANNDEVKLFTNKDDPSYTNDDKVNFLTNENGQSNANEVEFVANEDGRSNANDMEFGANEAGPSGTNKVSQFRGVFSISNEKDTKGNIHEPDPEFFDGEYDEVGSMELNTPSSKSEVSDIVSPTQQRPMSVESYEDDLGEYLDASLSPIVNDTDRENLNGIDQIGNNTVGKLLLEGSPDRGQRLYGSSQNLERRDGATVTKRKQAGRSMTPDSRFMLDKEVTESQNRKLQTEIATLQTENKLLKDKYNRSQARISDLETQLSEAQDELNNLQESLNQEVLDLSSRTKHELDRDRGNLEAKILRLSRENETFKSEITSLEKKLESSHRATDMARYNSEKSRTLEAHKSEITSLKEELNRVKALLEQSERHLKDEEERHVSTNKEMVKLTELKNALQQQEDSGGSGVYTEKQLMSLEKRLKVTEDRLHQERADRANNLSAVEDKLLTDNAKLQASEKELTRQLNREKDKTRNFEQRVKHLREENEKLRLAMPFDDTTLLSEKGKYDIPYSSHSNQRAETIKHISDDMNYILSQIEKQDGLREPRDEEEIIRVLWNKRELAYNQLREYDLQFQELQITENNKVDGLKNLRDTYGQAETKLHAMEEQLDDAKAQVITLDETYQQQLHGLVHERHEAFARLKTAEDLLEALRAENEMLHKNISSNHGGGSTRTSDAHTGKSFDALYAENSSLESKVSQLTRNIQLHEAQVTTLKVQVEARDQALLDVQNELDLAYKRLQGEDTDDRKQEKIDKLSSEVNRLQIELQHVKDKLCHSLSEVEKLQLENTSLRKQAGSHKTKLLKSDQSESKVVQQLRDELTEKDGRLTHVTNQLDDLENQLQKAREDLYVEQMNASEMEAECESLQLTVAQRAHMFEALSGTEREQLAQYQILKETLDSVSQELAQKQSQIISLDVNLSGARDKCTELEEEVQRLRKARHAANGDDNDVDMNVTYTEDEQSSAHHLKIKELEKERSLLKQELEQAYSAIQASEEQYRTLQTESTQLEQELVKEKTVILQLTAEKGEIEQHLEELAEEHDALIQEKTQAEDDLIKLETKLQEILQKYETQARKQHGNFEQEYPGLPVEANKVVAELESVKLLLDGKQKEVDMLNDRMNRHNIETEFLHRKVELIHNDSIANREDVARMISELTLKMKEAVSTREVNQFLVGERTKLQNEKMHLEKELETERRNDDQRKKEIQDVIRKIEKTETSQKSSMKDVRTKDMAITSLESELASCKQNVSSLETENAQLLGKVQRLTEDVNNLTGINTTLENRFESEKSALAEEKNAVTKWKEDFTQLSHDFEMLQHDHTVLTEKYEAEKETVANLKRDLQCYEEEIAALKEELENTKADRDTHKGQLLITKDSVQKLTQDKGNIYQDYEGMCRSLTEKERQLTELRERMDEKLQQAKREHAQDRARLEQDKTVAEKECETAKKEAERVNEQLRQKEVQLNSFGKTLQDLEKVTREKQQLEIQVQKLESSTGDSKLILEGQRKELMALNEVTAKQQEKSARLEAENTTLKADMKAEKETANRESRELNLMITELKSQQENERSYLNDNLAQTQTRLHTLEASLASAISDRDSLQAKYRLQEKTMEDLENKLSDESTGRRLAEQSVGSLRIQLEDMRNDKNVAEARFVEMKDQLTKAEDKLGKTVENTQQLSSQLNEVNAVVNTSRTNVKVKSEQVEALEKEVSGLKQMMESQKQSYSGKMKKSALEAKQKIESIEEERDKLALQIQQLSSSVDSCRETIASKNKDNLKLQEDILVLEDSVREAKLKQKTAEDTLRHENEKQAELTARFAAQDEELKRLRTFLAKKMENSSDTDKTMWQEMNKVIQELSHQMQNHLDATRGEGRDKNGDSTSTRLRKQLAEVQGDLNTEKSLHQITKTSLYALEEDCQRLRKQLQSLRRREPGEKRHKNRMEAINAIIARSQSQAQALLASGGYLDDTMNSPRYRSQHTSPRVTIHRTHRNESPDNSYSEDLSIASLPPMHMSTKKS